MTSRGSKQRNQALTVIDILVVIATLSLLATVALARVTSPAADAQRKMCVNNLKQIGLAFRIWAGDNGDRYPAQVPARLGGAQEAAARGNAAGIFQVMSNELSSPKILVCPADTNRFAADQFATGFDNSHLSYFAGVDANDRYPQRLLSGDSNLGVDDTSVKSGLAELAAGAPVSWTSERHVDQGNVGLADGSVQQLDQASLRQALQQSGLATNRLAIP